MIKLQNLCKVYQASDVETWALNSIQLNISEGEFVSIMGPSGCGKSTLLNQLGMLDAPTSGEYLFKGESISSCSETQLTRLRKKHLGFVFQSFNLINDLTVFQNVEMPLLYHRVGRTEKRQRALKILKKMNIAQRAGHYPQQLSGGQQQRVAIARALISQPSIIFADEPTGNLDSEHGQEVMELLRSLNHEGTTIIMVTHSETHAAYANRQLKLLDGKIIADNREELIHAA
jgi:putative ABC transport system ATP-binding protein